MPDLSAVTPQKLFKQWREGDAASGQAMAQRFSDWYYAVTACRLGDTAGRGPLQRACTRFQQGIVGVTSPNDLVGWAYAILSDELKLAGGRIAGGDFANAVTQNRSPTQILRSVRKLLPPEEVALLCHAYDATFSFERVKAEAQPLGGVPLAVLNARYRLKRTLRASAGVAFSEVPDEPNLDYGPLPLYEAGRMSNEAEEAGFEKWLLSNLPLCRDIAEFGVFALALRHGALADVEDTNPRPTAPSPRLPTPPRVESEKAPPPRAPAEKATPPPAPPAPTPVTTIAPAPHLPPHAGNPRQLGILLFAGIGALLLGAVVLVISAWYLNLLD